MHEPSPTPTSPSSSCNACKLCAPLGACLAFRGIEGALPLLHGSQGCATYIRRYMISHFREPLDVASSSFDESAAIFGGQEKLMLALRNVILQYHPALIGIATTCLAETLGEDVRRYLIEFARMEGADQLPLLVSAATPSYAGTHADGYFTAIRATVEMLAHAPGPATGRINLLPGMVSPADLRWLQATAGAFQLEATLLPDFADALDGPAWDDYQLLPSGGTPLAEIQAMHRSVASLVLSATVSASQNAGLWLQQQHAVPLYQFGLPIGIRASDAFYECLAALAGRPIPSAQLAERGRLVDALVDGHKYVSAKRVAIYGEEDLVAALAGFAAEIGLQPVLCASGGQSGQLARAIAAAAPDLDEPPTILEGVDFAAIEQHITDLAPDLLLGNSKGYAIARRLNLPLVRVGFPIHDRLGAARIHLLGYSGAIQLYDRLVNALIEHSQDTSPVGYSYI
jgi:nitrogenase molybdenum-iron protein NifN